MTLTQVQQAMVANEILCLCLQEANGDTEAGFAAAEYILSTQNISLGIDQPTPKPEPPPPEPEPVDAALAHDIHNRLAQGILNRSIKAAKQLTGAARKELVAALKTSNVNELGTAILKFVDKYRVKLANLLGVTQLASILEGAREISTDLPTLATWPGAAPAPPTLEPKEAVALVDRLEKLPAQDRAEAIYNLPPDQQTYAHHALLAKEAAPPAPPDFTPPAPAKGEPEEIHFPVIEEAVKQLTEKNVMTRDRYDALDSASRAKAFTVANISAEETLTKIKNSIAENIKEGVDYETWKGKVLQDVDKGTFLSDGHQETVFRTTVQTQFSDGQEAVLAHPLVRSGFPYRARDAIHDERVRKNHLALERMGIQGTNIYRADDPVWQLFRAPWDYNDRCSDTPMTVRQAAEAGIKEAQQWLETGVEPSPPAHVAMPDFRPPPGFQRVPVSAPMSIQLAAQSITLSVYDNPDKFWGAEQPATTPYTGGEEGYPRDSSNRFLDKYKIASAARDPIILTELLESIPEDQRAKLHHIVQHLQAGGSIYHPRESQGLAIDKDGIIVNQDWATYDMYEARYEEWEDRQACRDEYRRAADEATEAIRKEVPDPDEIEKLLNDLGITDADRRTIARMRHQVTAGKKFPDQLHELYEDLVELIHRRLDAEEADDPEPSRMPRPTEPETNPVALSANQQALPDSPEPPEERNQRLDLIAGILALLYGEHGVEVAKKLVTKRSVKPAAQAALGGIAFGYDNQGNWHGPNPPSPTGWYRSAVGPLGGLIWSKSGVGGGGFSPGVGGAPSSTPYGTTSHHRRHVDATSAYHSAIDHINAGQPLTPIQKNDLAKTLSVMSKQQLDQLYNALGGTAAIVGTQRQPWVHAIKAILTGAPVPQRIQPAQPQATAAQAAGPQRLTSTIPFKQETTWETGKAQPGTLNGIDFAPAPPKFWEQVKDVDLNEPDPIRNVDRVGVLIREPDGRIWIVQPTNQFGNRNYTLPGGGVEAGLSMQQNALKEVWEETGLQVKLTGHLGDFRDSNNNNNGRLYIGERIGGAPWDAKIENHIRSNKTGQPAAESEAVSLVTPGRAAQLLHRTDDLAQLATVNPIKLDTPTGSNMLKKFVEGIKPAAEAYKKKKKAKGQDPGNAYLHIVQNMRGFNEKPKVVNKASFDAIIAQGDHIEMLRGVTDSGSMSAKKLAEEFKSGDNYPGHGVFGSGTYTDSNKGIGNVAANSYSNYGSGELIRMALPKSAKIVKVSDLEKAVTGNPSEYRTPYGAGSGGSEENWMGIQAALAGYDAIYVDGKSSRHYSYGKGFYVILNRSIVTVQKEAPAKGYRIK